MLAAKILLLLLAVSPPSKDADPYQSALAAAVHHFAREGNLDHLKAIVDRHPRLVDVLEPFPEGHKPYSTEGYTPLHWAARSDHAAVAEYLIRRGAKINADDGSGWTPLHLAAQQGHLDVVKLLVSHHANVHARTEAVPEYTGVLPGAPPIGPGSPAEPPKTYPAIPSRTPLEWAAVRGQAKVVEYLKSLKK